MRKVERCCCTCDRNKRIEDENGMVTHCECEIDKHYIGYLSNFEYSCRHYTLDKAYKPGGKWYKEDAEEIAQKEFEHEADNAEW